MRLSKKYGFNPTLLICPICKKDVGVGLLGANNGKKAPMQTNGELCDDCKKEYVTILEVENRKQTGRRVFVKREAINVEVKDFACMESSEFIKLFSEPLN